MSGLYVGVSCWSYGMGRVWYGMVWSWYVLSCTRTRLPASHHQQHRVPRRPVSRQFTSQPCNRLLPGFGPLKAAVLPGAGFALKHDLVPHHHRPCPGATCGTGHKSCHSSAMGAGDTLGLLSSVGEWFYCLSRHFPQSAWEKQTNMILIPRASLEYCRASIHQHAQRVPE